MNVQQTIVKGVKEQLFFNNYLVIPNFGGFVVKSNPAHFSKSGGLIVPPSKTVSFNVQLKQNDGILTLWLQDKIACSSTEAFNHLTDFSDYCSSILNTRRRFTLDSIGFFYLDFENNICFEPQADTNLLTDSFGLAAISVRELEPTMIVSEKRNTVFVDRKLATEIMQPSPQKRNYRKVILPILLSLIFLSLLSLFVSTRNISGKLNASLFETSKNAFYNPISYSELKLSSVTDENPVYVADANGIANIEVEKNKTISVKATESSILSKPDLENNAIKLSNVRSNSKFEIVLGCFTVIENANKMVKKLSKQNVKAFLSGQNNKGMYVVSNGSFDSKDEAVEKLTEIKDSFPNAWIKTH